MKIGDLVKHKYDSSIGIVTIIDENQLFDVVDYFIKWMDDPQRPGGTWCRAQWLEVINEKGVNGEGFAVPDASTLLSTVPNVAFGFSSVVELFHVRAELKKHDFPCRIHQNNVHQCHSID